jgi:hypothetical protein
MHTCCDISKSSRNMNEVQLVDNGDDDTVYQST